MKNTVRIISLILAVMMLLSTTALAFEELAKGSKGDAVIELQNKLNEQGYSVGNPDGDFGGKTDAALRQYQEDNGLEVTGVLDEATYNVLYLGKLGASLRLVVCKDGKFGYIDGEGNIAIDCTWDEAYPFSEGLGRVKSGDKYGFVNLKGELVIPCEWHDATDFTGGVASVQKEEDGDWGAINKSGKIIIDLEWTHISPCNEDVIIAYLFSEDYTTVGMSHWIYSHNYAAFNSAGKQLCSWEEDAGDYEQNYNAVFSEGLHCSYRVRPNGSKNYTKNSAYINTKGKIVLELGELEFGSDFSEGLAPVGTSSSYYSDPLYGYINENGEEVIPAQWNFAWPFNNGMALVENGKKYGFIDKEGKEVIPCDFAAVSQFSEGLCAVKDEKNMWGFIDESGNMIIDFKFNEVSDFRNGYSLVTIGENKLYIDKRGEPAFVYDLATDIETLSEIEPTPIEEETIDFTLHSGVRFGMTMDEVIALEEENGFTPKKTKKAYSYYNDTGDYVSKKTEALEIYGSMAGISGSYLYYYFDSNGKLFAAVYDFAGEPLNDYDEIQALLEEKYGRDWASCDDVEYPKILDCLADNLINADIYAMDCYYVKPNEVTRIFINHATLYSVLPQLSEMENLMYGQVEHYLEYRLIPESELYEMQENQATAEMQSLIEQQAREEEIEREKNNDL